jgi:hypothetical protein
VGGVVGRKSDSALKLAESWGESVLPVIGGLLLEPSLFVGDISKMSSPAASLTRSSHLPRTASKLFPTRCDGAHFLGLAEGPGVPVVFVRIPIPDCELFLCNELPLPLEDVRSRRRVWYANGPEEVPDLGIGEALCVFELEGSISYLFH